MADFGLHTGLISASFASSNSIPRPGRRIEGNQPVNIAIDCEATDLIYRDGWYYLLGTHGTCCSGSASTYNIRVGRLQESHRSLCGQHEY